METAGRVSADSNARMGSDILLAQETGVKPNAEAAAMRALRRMSGITKTWVRLTRPHQGDVHSIGGLGTVAWGDAASRMTATEADARGWDRYAISCLQGRGGRKLILVNVYCPFRHSLPTTPLSGNDTIVRQRQSAPDVKGDSLWAQLVRLAEAEAAVADGRARKG